MTVYAELYEFNEQLLLNLKYGRSKLSLIADKFKYVNALINGEKLLKDDDNAFINNYFANLGTTDASSQIDYLNERKTMLKKYKEESEINYKKYSSLYIKISLMVGILIAVLLA